MPTREYQFPLFPLEYTSFFSFQPVHPGHSLPPTGVPWNHFEEENKIITGIGVWSHPEVVSPPTGLEAGQSKGSMLPWGRLSVTKSSHFHEWDPQRLIHSPRIPLSPPPKLEPGPLRHQDRVMSVPLDPLSPKSRAVSPHTPQGRAWLPQPLNRQSCCPSANAWRGRSLVRGELCRAESQGEAGEEGGGLGKGRAGRAGRVREPGCWEKLIDRVSRWQQQRLPGPRSLQLARPDLGSAGFT